MRLFLLGVVGIVGSATPASADSPYVTGNFVEGGQTAFQSQQSSTPDAGGKIKLGDSYATSNVVSTADATSAAYTVEVGAVKLKSLAQAADDQAAGAPYFVTELGVSAGWHDIFTIHTTPGQSGIATVNLIVAGSTAVTGNGGYGLVSLGLSATTYNQFSSGSFYLSGFSGNSDSNTFASYGVTGQPPLGSPFTTFTYQIRFLSDYEIPLTVVASCDSLAQVHATGGSSSADCALDHSVYWGGITAVTDTQFNPLTYTTASQSGFDYAHASPLATAGAVPEPASWSLMIVGFGLAGTATRRRAAQTV